MVSEGTEADRCAADAGRGQGGWAREGCGARSHAAFAPSSSLDPFTLPSPFSKLTRTHHACTHTYLSIFVAADAADLAKGALPNHFQDVVVLLGGGHGSCVSGGREGRKG